MAFFQKGLELIDFQHALGTVVSRLQVGDERKDPVGQRLLLERLAVDGKGNRKNRVSSLIGPFGTLWADRG